MLNISNIMLSDFSFDQQRFYKGVLLCVSSGNNMKIQKSAKRGIVYA